MFRVIFFAFCFLGKIFAFECVDCHNVEKFDSVNHDFSCKECHESKISISKFKNRDKFGGFSHANIISHPASSEHYMEFCGKCHKDEILKFENSNHFTHKNEINTILTAFNMDLNLSFNDFKNGNFKNFSDAEKLILDFIDRKCLKCHVQNNGENFAYSKHGQGCMSCHSEYDKLGKYKGSDANSSISNHSNTHKLNKPTTSSCQSCHNKYFIGGDFSGLFPQNVHKDYKTPLSKDGKFPPQIHGATYTKMRADVHFMAGISCNECHKMNENKSCESCHSLSDNISHKYHKNVECNACHASWGGNFYELNAMLDYSTEFDNWKDLVQSDSTVRNLKLDANKTPKSRSLNGENKDGIWHSAFSLERFENLLLVNKNGKISLARPIFQYNLSVKDKNATITSFSKIANLKKQNFAVFKPFAPHTISKKGKNCESCHDNELQNGKNYGGISKLFTPKFCDDNNSEIFSDCVKLLDATPLNDEQKMKLNSKIYKKIRAKELIK